MSQAVGGSLQEIGCRALTGGNGAPRPCTEGMRGGTGPTTQQELRVPLGAAAMHWLLAGLASPFPPILGLRFHEGKGVGLRGRVLSTQVHRRLDDVGNSQGGWA